MLFRSVSSVVTIYEHSADVKTERVRIYEYRYSGFLTAKIESGSIIKKSFFLFFALMERFPRFIVSLFNLRNSIPMKYKLQSIYFTLSYILVTLLSLLTLPAILTSFGNLIPDDLLTDFPTLLKVKETLVNWSRFLVGSFALILLTAPKVRSFVSVVGTEYLALNYYFKYGESRLKLIGKLSRLLEFISEREEVKNISIHGYSMGSIIGIDALFPYESSPNYRFRNKVKQLVTL